MAADTAVKSIGIILAVVIGFALLSTVVFLTKGGERKVGEGGKYASGEGVEGLEGIFTHPVYMLCQEFYNNNYRQKAYYAIENKMPEEYEGFCQDYGHCALRCGVLLELVNSQVRAGKIDSYDKRGLIYSFYRVYLGGDKKFFCPLDNIDPENNCFSIDELWNSDSASGCNDENLQEICESMVDAYYSGDDRRDDLINGCKERFKTLTLNCEGDLEKSGAKRCTQEECSPLFIAIRNWYAQDVLFGGGLATALNADAQWKAMDNLVKWVEKVVD